MLHALSLCMCEKLLRVDFFHAHTISSERLNDTCTCSFERLDANSLMERVNISYELLSRVVEG